MMPPDPAIRVVRWRRYGHDRLYVADEDGQQLGWHDLTKGHTHVTEPSRRTDVHQAVSTWLASTGHQAPERAGAVAPTRAKDPAHELKRDTAPEPLPAMPLELRAEDDLADRRAGALARERATSLREQAPVKTFIGRVLGAHTEERAWRVGAKGEERVGDRLEVLVRRDPRWRVLHSIGVGAQGSDIDHLVIGPGGVFTLNTKTHPRANIWLAGDVLMVNGQKQPYVRNSRHEAQRVSRLLSLTSGVAIQARGVIVLVGDRELTIKSEPPDVAVRHRESIVRWLGRQPDKLDGVAIERLYAAARRADTWRRNL
jgi:hypothetical protein